MRSIYIYIYDISSLRVNSRLTADCYLPFVSFRINHLKHEVNLKVVLKHSVLKS